jgi:hypothetical protein
MDLYTSGSGRSPGSSVGYRRLGAPHPATPSGRPAKHYGPGEHPSGSPQTVHGGGGDLGAAAVRSLQQRLSQPDGGFSIHTRSGRQPRTGYMVSIYPDRSVSKPAAQVEPAEIKRFLRANKDILRRPHHHFGGWHDPKTGMVWFDVAVRTRAREAAEALGRRHNQLAYYDLVAGKSVDIAKAYTPVRRAYGGQDPVALARSGGDGRADPGVLQGGNGAGADPGADRGATGGGRAGGVVTKQPLTRVLRLLEASQRRAVEQALRQLGGALDQAALERAISSGEPVEPILDALRVDRTLQPAVRVLRRAFGEGTRIAATARLASAFGVANALAVAWARDQGARLVTRVTDSAREAIAETIAEGVQRGWSPYRTARQVRDLVGLTPRDARAVARFQADLEDQGLAEATIERRVDRYTAAKRRSGRVGRSQRRLD